MTGGPSRRPVAVIGAAGRLPGAPDLDQHWQDVVTGRSRITRFGADDFERIGISADEYTRPGFVGASGLMDDPLGFDAAFFGLTPAEASLMDPQVRLVLESAYRALEQAGYPAQPDGQSIGVIASTGYGVYPFHQYLSPASLATVLGTEWPEQMQAQLGNRPDLAAARVAYLLGMNGPTFSAASACSSSLVGLHLACQALELEEADLMVVTTAALHFPQVVGSTHVKGSILSRSGDLRAFDRRADGTVGGNGTVAVVLKLLDRALQDGDFIRGVVRGTAVTSDGGDRAAISAPSSSGQREAAIRAMRCAGVTADELGYVETHGTGTYKGDPIEFRGLTEAFRRDTDKTACCALGAQKAGIGHLDAAAGLAAFVKALRVVQEGVVPPIIGLEEPNPRLELDDSPFILPRQVLPWPRTEGPRRAGVHSVGMGGTNAHAVIEGPPERVTPMGRRPWPAITPLSAPSPDRIPEYARALHAVVADEVIPSDDIARTLMTGRRQMRSRRVLAVSPGDREGLLAALERCMEEEPAALAAASTGTVAFAFSGQGTTYNGMAGPLAERFDVVAETVQECCRLHRELTGDRGLEQVLLDDSMGFSVDLRIAQPALLALQVAQVRLWDWLGVRPEVVLGHSAGENAALWAAGALSLEDSMRLVTERGHLMASCPPGGMLAVLASAAEVQRIVGRFPGLEEAVVNGPRYRVLAGDETETARACAQLVEEGIQAELIPVQRALHCTLLEPALPGLKQVSAGLEFRPTELTVLSGAGGDLHVPGWVPEQDYPVRQSRAIARFDRQVDLLCEADVTVAVEIGPLGSLSGLVNRGLTSSTCLPTQRWRRETETFWESLGAVFRSGTDIRWDRAAEGCGGGRTPLPGVPFVKKQLGLPEHLKVPRPGAQSPGHQCHTAFTEGKPMYDTAVLDRVIELAARQLGLPRGDISVEEPLTALGADSLQLIGLLRQVENEFGVDLSPRDLIASGAGPGAIARQIAERAPQEAVRENSPDAAARVQPRPAEGSGTSSHRMEPVLEHAFPSSAPWPGSAPYGYPPSPAVPAPPWGYPAGYPMSVMPPHQPYLHPAPAAPVSGVDEHARDEVNRLRHDLARLVDLHGRLVDHVDRLTALLEKQS